MKSSVKHLESKIVFDECMTKVFLLNLLDKFFVIDTMTSQLKKASNVSETTLPRTHICCSQKQPSRAPKCLWIVSFDFRFFGELHRFAGFVVFQGVPKPVWFWWLIRNRLAGFSSAPYVWAAPWAHDSELGIRVRMMRSQVIGLPNDRRISTVRAHAGMGMIGRPLFACLLRRETRQ